MDKHGRPYWVDGAPKTIHRRVLQDFLNAAGLDINQVTRICIRGGVMRAVINPYYPEPLRLSWQRRGCPRWLLWLHDLLRLPVYELRTVAIPLIGDARE